MYKEILLIVNPEASKGKGRKKAKEICKYLERNHLKFATIFTSGKGHAEQLALKGAKDGYHKIVAVGGDGTVNEVINGIMRSGLSDKVKMGIIPIGRGNDFAWVCGIPKNTKKAVALISQGEGKKTDVGFCYGPDRPEGMYFLNGAGFGFEPMVNFKAMEYPKLNGMPSYIVAFIWMLKHYPDGYKIKMTLDSAEEKFVTTQQISVANGIRMGSMFKMTPNAVIDDGKLDLMFTNNPLKGLGIISMVCRFFMGAQTKDKENFTYLNVSKIEIEGDQANIPVHLDGEVYSKNVRKATIEIRSSAIELLR